MTAPDSGMTNTIPDRVKQWADLYPNKEVFIFYSDEGRRALTCRDVYVYAMKFAALLQRRGLKQGDVVCNTLTNSPERIVTDFGIMAAGCISANAQALLTDGSDLLYVINVSKCRLLVVDNTLSGGAWDILKVHLGEVVDQHVRSDKTPELEMVEFVGVAKDTGFLQELLIENDPTPMKISPTDNAAYWSTSGTTGFSKLVVRKHESFILMSSYYTQLFHADITFKLYSDRPLGWAGGWPYSFLDKSLTQVLTDTRGPVTDQYQLTWKAIQAEKCTFAAMTIAFMKALAERKDVLEQKGASLLKMIIAAGQPFRKHCHDVLGKLCHSVSSAYGLTEAGYITSCVCEKEEDFEDNLVGRPSHLLEMKIVDEEFRDLQPGENGQVLVRSSLLFQEYANNPEATKTAFTEDGWFKTNDMGHVDEKGRFLIEGRRSDAIMHGQYIIYPSWVERKLRSCPYVAEVMVVGIPDETMQHLICACVIPKSGQTVTSEMLMAYCGPLFTANTLYEMSAKPDFYITVERFPLRPTGKPDRRALADLAAKLVKVKSCNKNVNGIY